MAARPTRPRPGRMELREAPPPPPVVDHFGRGYFLYDKQEIQWSELQEIEDGLKLGEGHFGSVNSVLVTGTFFRAHCARKSIRVTANEESLQQTRRELEMLHRAANPHIVSFFGFQALPGTLSLYMERMAASLADLLVLARSQGQAIPDHVLRNIAVSTLKGLSDFFKAEHAIHRDIKPGNILLARNGVIKLGDLGLARITDPMGFAYTITGSEIYSPPERIQIIDASEQRGYDLRVDVWALGLTVLELASHRFPYLAPLGQPFQILIKITEDEPPRCPEHYSPELQDFIAACLQKSLRSRPFYSQSSEDHAHPPLESMAIAQQPFASRKDMVDWYVSLLECPHPPAIAPLLARLLPAANME